jgi:hypothetical protein
MLFCRPRAAPIDLGPACPEMRLLHRARLERDAQQI